MQTEGAAGAAAAASIPESVTAASTYGDANVDLHVAQQLIDQSLAIEDIARELLTNALHDHA